MSKKSISPRRLPSQKRSKERVETILNTAVGLLEKGGVEEVTAIKIASEAGIAVASVYQYFPNRNAIIYTLYQKWLQNVNEKIDIVEKATYLEVPIFEFFKQIQSELAANSCFSEKAELELYRAMEIYPELQELDRNHGQQIVDKMARYMKEYGSQWSMKRLKNLGWFIYLTANAIIRGSIERNSETARQFNEWGEVVLKSLLNECINE